MNVTEATFLMQETLRTALMLAAPMLLLGLAAGLAIAIFQAVTSIHEMTLTFIPKILAIVIGIFIFLPWMVQKILTFASNVFLMKAG
jgi:flagellar biosynthetic protein FliQ